MERWHRGSRTGAVFAVPAGGLAVASLARAADSASDVATQVTRDLDLQQQLPSPEIAHEATKIPWQINLPVGDILIIVVSIAVAVAVLLALYSIRDRLPALGRRRLAADPRTASVAASVENMVASQLEADRLALSGQFGEAMHTLLLRSLIEMRKTLDIAIPDSLTSREVLGKVVLPVFGKQALGDLIQRVEPVYFGERAADEGSYAACRRSYLGLIGAIQNDVAGVVRA